MKLARLALFAAVLSIAALVACGSAGAANVIVGPNNLTSSEWESEEPCAIERCSIFNTELEGTGPNVASPVTGAIVRFNVLSGGTGGTFRLRTAVRLGGSLKFVFVRMSPLFDAGSTAGLESFTTSLPISAGETIGLSTEEKATVSFFEAGEHRRIEEGGGELPEGGEHEASSIGAGIGLFGFNAEVQPAPTITSVGTSAGRIVIAGSDLEAATVTYGGSPMSIQSNTESEIVTNPLAVPTATGTTATSLSIPVTVTTIAGSATSPLLTLIAPPTKPAPVARCVVPKLKGKNLKAAKRALLKAKCKPGTVTKVADATAKSGRVNKQGPKPGKRLAVGTKVNVTLK